MGPVKGSVMLNFLNWLVEEHPEIRTLHNLPDERLLQLVTAFENERPQDYDYPKGAWVIGIRDFLLPKDCDWEYYEEARKEYRKLFK